MLDLQAYFNVGYGGDGLTMDHLQGEATNLNVSAATPAGGANMNLSFPDSAPERIIVSGGVSVSNSTGGGLTATRSNARLIGFCTVRNCLD